MLIDSSARRPASRRGIAALELAMALPTMVLLLALIFALASITLEQTRAAIDARHAAWRLGPPGDATPLRLAFDPQSDLAASRATRHPRIARPLRLLDRDVAARVALLRGTWDSTAVRLDQPTDKPFLPHLEVLEQVVQGAVGVPGLDASADLTNFTGGSDGEKMTQVEGFDLGGSSLGLPGGGLSGLPLDEIKKKDSVDLALPGTGGGGGGVGGFVNNLGGGAVKALTGGTFPGFDPGKAIDLGSLGGATDLAAEGLTESQKILMEAGRDLLFPVNEALGGIVELGDVALGIASKMVKLAGGKTADLDKAIDELKKYEEMGLPTQKLIDASRGD